MSLLLVRSSLIAVNFGTAKHKQVRRKRTQREENLNEGKEIVWMNIQYHTAHKPLVPFHFAALRHLTILLL